MRDRIDRNPNEFEIVPVDGKPGRYTIRKVLDGVEEMGTAICKATMLSDETADRYGGTPESTVNDMWDLVYAPVSYYLFCSKINASTLDLAFGKDDPGIVKKLGEQLVSYARFCGDTAEYKYIPRIHTYQEVYEDFDVMEELLLSDTLLALVESSPWAKGILESHTRNIDDTIYPKFLGRLAGVADYDRIASYSDMCSNVDFIEGLFRTDPSSANNKLLSKFFNSCFDASLLEILRTTARNNPEKFSVTDVSMERSGGSNWKVYPENTIIMPTSFGSDRSAGRMAVEFKSTSGTAKSASGLFGSLAGTLYLPVASFKGNGSYDRETFASYFQGSIITLL